ncbi:BHLH domain-containing protein [Mycena chlorophos]|uniref:BHLH domain-containing protein n=1 Tax=Mycena chlorophos TaxID=658473 RepID=A0A8H6SGX1_MYCCL|nr:BHLH domain-containing protein [Mycena chlorophos]
MSSTIYAGSCNPPRSARQTMRARSPSESSSASEYTPEPRLSPKIATVDPPSATASVGPKRGRKPAVLSRTAREAQRKLNHSIIEKASLEDTTILGVYLDGTTQARRTKINEALATLKQLVPASYGQQQADEADDAEEEGSKKKGGKEKEFKLEILIKTVAYMEDLVERVRVLEAGPSCSNCKRKRSQSDVTAEAPPEKRRQTSGDDFSLPPISAWLSPEFSSHLPSPPSSARVAPTASIQLPPALSLGPGATQQPHPVLRTPEDEHVASMLLEMGGSRDVQTPASLLGLGKR